MTARASKQIGIERNGLSFWIACIRECFEEAGVFLLIQMIQSSKISKSLDKLRTELNNKEITFKDICISESLSLRAKNIVPCAHWITPALSQKDLILDFFLPR